MDDLTGLDTGVDWIETKTKTKKTKRKRKKCQPFLLLFLWFERNVSYCFGADLYLYLLYVINQIKLLMKIKRII
jgi:hypothetical protein